MFKLYNLFNSLTGGTKKRLLPDGFSDKGLADAFCKFFKDKIATIISNFENVPTLPSIANVVVASRLENFKTINKDKLDKVFQKAKKTHCAKDPIPISDIVDADNFSNITHIILKIVNSSILSSKFPSSEKRAIVKPVLKGKLDHQNLSSFRPVSNLSFLSKILEYVVLDQLMMHLEEVNVLPPNQSAYRQLYSTETTICSVVNDLLVITSKHTLKNQESGGDLTAQNGPVKVNENVQLFMMVD